VNILLADVIQGFPPLSAHNQPTYAFDRTVIEAAESWIGSSQDTEDNQTGAIRSLIECARHLDSPDRLEEEILGLPWKDEATQYVLTQALRPMAYAAKFPVEFMRECLWNSEWLLVAATHLFPAALNNILDGIAEIQVQQGGEWLSRVPHLLVGLCESMDVTNESYSDVVDMTILNSINAGTVSALRRLRGIRNQTVVTKLAEWKQRLETALQTPLSWPQAKLRGILSALSEVATLKESK
jgi:hypothetical protein